MNTSVDRQLGGCVSGWWIYFYVSLISPQTAQGYFSAFSSTVRGLTDQSLPGSLLSMSTSVTDTSPCFSLLTRPKSLCLFFLKAPFFHTDILSIAMLYFVTTLTSQIPSPMTLVLPVSQSNLSPSLQYHMQWLINLLSFYLVVQLQVLCSKSRYLSYE